LEALYWERGHPCPHRRYRVPLTFEIMECASLSYGIFPHGFYDIHVIQKPSTNTGGGFDDFFQLARLLAD
jgi:hypothetical protein